MKVLIDHNLPRQLYRFLPGHLVRSAANEGWDRLPDGDLLRFAEMNGFEVLITADQDLYDQQNHAERRIALVVLTSNRKHFVLQHGDAVREAVESATLGSYQVVLIPVPPKQWRSATS